MLELGAGGESWSWERSLETTPVSMNVALIFTITLIAIQRLVNKQLCSGSDSKSFAKIL